MKVDALNAHISQKKVLKVSRVEALDLLSEDGNGECLCIEKRGFSAQVIDLWPAETRGRRVFAMEVGLRV